MRFVETPIFTRLASSLWDDDEYFALQSALMVRPTLGAVIRGSGGLRKTRWSLSASGKRGGVRLIYYWDVPSETFYMLYAYRKNERDDITPRQVRMLRLAVREEFG